MLRLFVKDNTNGEIHEYGTNQHDALILQNDGSLHYENLQCCAGTMFPEEGYSFCLEDGTIPEWDLEYGVEPYLDIGGEHYTKPKTNADRIRAMSDEELAVAIAKNTYTGACNDFGIPHTVECCGDCEKCDAIIKWLKQPAE